MNPASFVGLKRYRGAGLAGDLRGGVTAAVIGIPVELVYGLIATSPLGIDYQTAGVLAAFNACIVAAIVGAAGGMHLGQIPGARPALALVCAALLSDLMHQWPQRFGTSADPSQLLLIMFATVILGGLLQIGFGIFRLGQLVKYLPAPVLSGITNGVAILMVMQILKPLLGIPRTLSWSDPAAIWQAMHPLSIVIGLTAAYLYVRPPKVLARIPSILVSLTASVLAFHGLNAILGSGHLGQTFGAIPASIPKFIGAELYLPAWQDNAHAILRMVFPYALTIAALASIESLVSAAAVDAIRHTRHSSNRELIAQGLGNVAAGLFGGSPIAATMPRTMANTAAGAQSSLAAIVYAATILGLLLLIADWIGAIPQVATAGILLGVAWQMIDPWSRRTLRAMVGGRRGRPPAPWKAGFSNGVVMLGVAISALTLGLVWALALGVVLTTVFFLRSNQRAVVRSISSGLETRSLRVRPVEQTRFLDLLGADIAIVEAQGPLFFASADNLQRAIDGCLVDADVIVLDLSRVTYVDATAARVLNQLSARLERAQKAFHLCGLHSTDETRVEINWMLADAGLDPRKWFVDLDTALEATEDELLAVRFDPKDFWREYPLTETTLGNELNPDQIEVLRSCLVEKRFAAQDIIYGAFETGESLYVLTRGAVSLYLDVSAEKRMRLASFSAGTVVGALGMLGGTPRTSTAVADVDVVTLELTAAALELLSNEHPEVAVKVYRNLSTILADRLSHTLDSLRTVISD